MHPSIQSLDLLILVTGLTRTTFGLMSLILYYQYQYSSCMKKIKVWSTLVWKRKIKEPQERSGCIHFLLEIKTSSWKNLQASKRKIKTDCRSWKMFSKIFWCKKRSKCAQVSHIHALKVGQLFLSVRNQVQIVYLVPFFAKK